MIQISFGWLRPSLENSLRNWLLGGGIHHRADGSNGYIQVLGFSVEIFWSR